jgi:hypothetical protein
MVPYVWVRTGEEPVTASYRQILVTAGAGQAAAVLG